MRPVEGTMLTVAADAAAAAQQADAEGGGTLLEVFEAAREAAVSSLWRTPELLPVLAQAGVVDAGGAGLLLLYDAFLHVIDGRPLVDRLPLPPEVADKIAGGFAGDQSRQNTGGSARGGSRRGRAGLSRSLAPGVPTARLTGGESASGAGPRYEVMFFLEAPDETLAAFKSVWAGIGDSIVVVGGDGFWNCHIHSDDIGAAVEAALDVGRPATSVSPTCSTRSRRSRGYDARPSSTQAQRRVPRSLFRSPRSSPWRRATGSAASSIRSVSTTSWAGGSR